MWSLNWMSGIPCCGVDGLVISKTGQIGTTLYVVIKLDEWHTMLWCGRVSDIKDRANRDNIICGH